MSMTETMRKINAQINRLPQMPVVRRPDVFISYSSTDKARVVELAAFLEQAGFAPWWAAHLRAGEHFHDVIFERLDAVDAAIVLWSHASVRSGWVEAEATRALELGKLVPVRLPDLGPRDIPPQFWRLHTIPLDERDALVAALQGLVSSRQSATCSPVHRPGTATRGSSAP